MVLQLSCSRHLRLTRWGCENEAREMNKTPKSTSHCVCHSRHSLFFTFARCKTRSRFKMQNQAGGRTCLSILMKLHSTNARVGQVVVVKICRLLSSCDQVVNPVEMCFLLLASCCAASKKQFTLHQMLYIHFASVCQQKRARLLPYTHRPWILPTAVSAARRATPLLRNGWKTSNEEPLKSNECPSENWVRCECWLGIKCWTIDQGASAVYVPQSLISNIHWCEKTKKGLRTFTLCIWPHFAAKLLCFIYSR